MLTRKYREVIMYVACTWILREYVVQFSEVCLAVEINNHVVTHYSRISSKSTLDCGIKEFAHRNLNIHRITDDIVLTKFAKRIYEFPSGIT